DEDERDVALPDARAQRRETAGEEHARVEEVVDAREREPREEQEEQERAPDLEEAVRRLACGAAREDDAERDERGARADDVGEVEERVVEELGRREPDRLEDEVVA